ncbi:MAG: hypothetical protein WC889_09005 [Myxococcota bacterium]
MEQPDLRISDIRDSNLFDVTDDRGVRDAKGIFPTELIGIWERILLRVQSRTEVNIFESKETYDSAINRLQFHNFDGLNILDLYTTSLNGPNLLSPISSEEPTTKTVLVSETADFHSDQIFLPLDVPFSPSGDLLQLWVNGIESYAEEAFPGTAEYKYLLNNKANFGVLSKEFTKLIYESIIIYATMRSYEQSSFKISLGGRLLVSLQGQVLRNFFVRPDEGSEFFSLLVEEIISFLRAGNQFGGDWGALVLDAGDDLLLQLTRPKKLRTRGFSPSDED